MRHSPLQSRVKCIERLVTTPDHRRDLYRIFTKIASINHPKLEEGGEVDVNITDFHAVSSYNWKDQKEPYIIVPGSPRIWQEKPSPFKLSRDRRECVDQNSSYLSTPSLLPLIVAVNCHNPRFHMGEMDFITDRNSLRKLLRWVRQSRSHRGYGLVERGFRIDIERTGKTILLQRREVGPTEFSSLGYEKNFQRYTTSQIPECEATCGHYRIVSFKFGDKRILMRFAIDACLPSEGPAREDSRDSTDDLVSKSKFFDIPRLPEIQQIPTFKGGFLTVKTAGKLVPQESIIELKTRGRGTRTCYDEVYVQSLIAGISNVYIGRHNSGNFYEVEKTTLVVENEETKEATESHLKLLKKTLDEIQRITLENLEDGENLSLVLREHGGALEVVKRRNRDGVLPENILAIIRSVS